MALAGDVTDANAAIFDAANGFAGCIAGIHEILRRQGLMAGRWCLDPKEDLSPASYARSTASTRPTRTCTTKTSSSSTATNGSGESGQLDVDGGRVRNDRVGLGAHQGRPHDQLRAGEVVEGGGHGAYGAPERVAGGVAPDRL